MPTQKLLCVCVRMYVCIHGCMYKTSSRPTVVCVYTYTCIYACMYMRLVVFCWFVRAFVCMCVKKICECMHACMHLCMQKATFWVRVVEEQLCFNNKNAANTLIKSLRIQ
jgi:hypothetical protein